MTDRYDTITERRLDWEALDRMPEPDEVFLAACDALLKARGIEPCQGVRERRAWRPKTD